MFDAGRYARSRGSSGVISGRVVAWGDNGHGHTSVPAGTTDAIALATGGNPSPAIIGRS
jgi:hypothetical protein